MAIQVGSSHLICDYCRSIRGRHDERPSHGAAMYAICERLASPRLFCLAHQNDALHTPALVRPCAAGRDRHRGRRIHAVSEPFSSPVLLEERQRPLHQTTPPLGCSFAGSGGPSWRKRCSPTRIEPSSSYMAKYKTPGRSTDSSPLRFSERV
jgi:hypothetical protein